MKVFILASLILFSTHSYAVCENLGEDSLDIFDGIEGQKFETITEKFLKKDTFFTDSEKALVFKMLDYISYGPFERNWNQVVSEFSFPESYNELHLHSFREVSTQRVYTYVWSYPGDNEYGLIFNEQGEKVAEVGDGDLYCESSSL